MLTVGGLLFDKVDDNWIRMSTPFGGGVGMSRQEMCGALAGGLLLIGLLYGRTSKEQSTDLCQAIVKQFRERFSEAFGYTNCHDLRELAGFGADVQLCLNMIAQSMVILLDVLKDAPQIEASLPTSSE